MVPGGEDRVEEGLASQEADEEHLPGLLHGPDRGVGGGLLDRVESEHREVWAERRGPAVAREVHRRDARADVDRAVERSEIELVVDFHTEFKQALDFPREGLRSSALSLVNTWVRSRCLHEFVQGVPWFGCANQPGRRSCKHST